MTEALTSVELKERLGQANVTGLFEYPVKSFAGHTLSVGEVVERGFKHDRRFMVISTDPVSKRIRSPEFTTVSNAFVTQGEFPRMSLIVPHLTDESLTLAAPGVENLVIPIKTEGDPKEVVVWSDPNVQVIDQGNYVAEWLGDFLEAPSLRLVRMHDSYVRQVDQNFAPRPTDQVSLADGYPFTVISQESLDELNRRLKERKPDHPPIGMNRFRPNIVIGGSGIPHGEDLLKEFQIGEVVFEGVKNNIRCRVTQVVQEIGDIIDSEPIATLNTYRAVPKASGKGVDVEFAQNLTHKNNGLVRVGDSVKVRSTKIAR